MLGACAEGGPSTTIETLVPRQSTPNRRMHMSLMPVPPGMKVAAQVSPEADSEELQFVRQMGIDWAVCWTDGAHAGYDY